MMILWEGEAVKERYHLLDALRGFAIYHVIVFHFLYDVYVVYGLNPDWPYQTLVQLWQKNGCGLFVLVSGMVFALGRSVFKRGLQLQLLGLLITAVTIVCAPDEAIYYGILTFFGSALWLTWLLRGVLQQVHSCLGMVACVVLYVLTKGVSSGVASVGGSVLFQWPQWLYQDCFAILGFHGAGFTSADYVPLLPNVFVFWFGMYLFAWLRDRQLLAYLYCCNWKLFTLPGKRSLEIYLVHQPVLMLLCYLIFGRLP